MPPQPRERNGGIDPARKSSPAPPARVWARWTGSGWLLSLKISADSSSWVKRLSDRATLVAKLRGARERKKAKTGKAEGRKSYAEANPKLVELVHQLSKRRPPIVTAGDIRRTCVQRLHHAARPALFGFSNGVDAGALGKEISRDSANRGRGCLW